MECHSHVEVCISIQQHQAKPQPFYIQPFSMINQIRQKRKWHLNPHTIILSLSPQYAWSVFTNDCKRNRLPFSNIQILHISLNCLLSKLFRSPPHNPCISLPTYCHYSVTHDETIITYYITILPHYLPIQDSFSPP